MLLENISSTKDDLMKNHKELWESQTSMVGEWKQAIDGLQLIIDNKAALL